MIFRVPLILLAIAQLAWTRDRVVLLVGNRSNNPAAAVELAPAVVAQLSDKGYDVVPPLELAAALEKAGMTASDEIDPASAEKVRAALGATGVVTVSVSFFLGSQPRARGAPAHPAFGLTARLLAGGKTPWSSSLGWIADDVPPPAGFGSKRAQPKPTAQACERLLWSLPRGRPDPAARAVKVADAEPVRAPVSNRWAPPPARLRDFKGVAHFPLKIR